MPLTPDQLLCLIASAPFLALGALYVLGNALLAAADALFVGRA